MDKYQSLLQDGNYRTVLDLTKDHEDPASVYAHVSALIYLKLRSKALDYLLQYKKIIFADDPIRFITTHIDILTELGRFQDAYAAADEYQDGPYISMEIEDFLKQLPDYIAKREKQDNHFIDDERLERMLREDSNADIQLRALSYLQNHRAIDYTDDIVALSESATHFNVRVFALFLLISLSYDRPIDFLTRKGKIQSIVPKTLIPPFSSMKSQELRKKIRTFDENTSANNVSWALYEQLAINMYPESLDSFPSDELLVALNTLAYEALGMSANVDKNSRRHHVDKGVTAYIYRRLKENL